MDTAIAHTKEMLDRFVQNYVIRHAYLLREMAIMDEASRMEGV